MASVHTSFSTVIVHKIDMLLLPVQNKPAARACQESSQYVSIKCTLRFQYASFVTHFVTFPLRHPAYRTTEEVNNLYLNLIDRFSDEQRRQHRRMASLEMRSDKLDAYFNDLKEENLVCDFMQIVVVLFVASVNL